MYITYIVIFWYNNSILNGKKIVKLSEIWYINWRKAVIIKEYEGQMLQKYNFNFKKGSVEMLILRLLSNHDCYGYQLTQIIKKLSDGLIIIPSGSLYPILYKLLDEGYITEYAVKSGRRQERIYYHLVQKKLNN